MVVSSYRRYSHGKVLGVWLLCSIYISFITCGQISWNPWKFHIQKHGYIPNESIDDRLGKLQDQTEYSSKGINKPSDSNKWRPSELFHQIKHIYQKINHNIQSRKQSMNTYQDHWNVKLQEIITKFYEKQLEETKSSLQSYELMMNQLQEIYRDLYSDAIEILEKQKLDLNELNLAWKQYEKITQNFRVDESLEQLKNYYNRSNFTDNLQQLIPTTSFSGNFNFTNLDKLFKSFEDNSKDKFGWKLFQTTEKNQLLQDFLDDTNDLVTSMKTTINSKFQLPSSQNISTSNFYHFLNPKLKMKYDRKLQKNLIKNWENILFYISESSKNAESISKPTIHELTKLQDDLRNQLMIVTNVTKNGFVGQKAMKTMREDMRMLEERFKRLEQELAKTPMGKSIESQKKHFEGIFRSIQEKISITNSTYDGLISKKRNTMYHNYMNDITLNKVLKLIDKDDKGWQKIRSEDGIDVYRKFMGIGPGSQYSCVRCSAVINSSLDSVYELFTDDSRIREYNSFYEAGRDLEFLTENTRAVWTASPPVFPFKARDFCTAIHTRRLKDGTAIILNRAISHPLAPPTSTYVRAAIILGANIIQPVPGHSHKCRLTMLTQVDPGGFTPPMIVNHISALGPVGFMKNVEAAARKRKRVKR